MTKKIITLPLLAATLFAFASPALSGEWGKGEKHDCDKSRKEECSKSKKECDKSKKDCDKSGYRGKGGKHGDRHGLDILKYTEELGLDDKQVAEIREIKTSYKMEKITLDAEIDVMELELKELHRDYSKGIDVLSRIIREIEAKKGDLRIAKYKMMRDIREIMTAEQRDKFKAIFMKMKADKK